MKLKPILPAAALLVLLMPSQAWSKNHHDFDNVDSSAVAQTGSLTPFSHVDTKNYLSGNVDQYANAFDPNAANFGSNQNGTYGGYNNNPYDANATANNYDLSNRVRAHRHSGGCNSERSQLERAMRNSGANPYTNPAYSSLMSNINNPAVNPFANPANNACANPYAAAMNNPYANGMNNPYASPAYGQYANPYGNPNASAFNSNPYLNGFYNNNGFSNSATSASNLSRLGSVLSGSGLGNLGAYVQNGSLNGGSLSGLRGLLGI
jgi:hypothetical protein